MGFSVFEGVVEGDYGGAEEVFDGFAQFFVFVFDEPHNFLLERTIFLLHFLLIVDIVFLDVVFLL